MIDQVMICGIRRGPELVSAIDINQMAGRCGRSYNASDKGIVTLFASSVDYQKASSLFLCDMPDVKSQMLDVDLCSLHILPNILCGDVHDQSSTDEWFSRTLAYFQGKRLKFHVLYDYLLSNRAIKGDSTSFCCTALGEVACMFYYGPEQMNILCTKLEELVSRDLVLDASSMSWCLSYSKSRQIGWRKLQGEAWESLESSLSSRSMALEEKEMHAAFCYYCMFHGMRPKDFRSDMSKYRGEAGRLFGAMKKMNQLYNFGIEDELLVMSTRLFEGVSFEVAKFMLESGVRNKMHAMKFMDFGITDKDSLRDKLEMIRDFGDERLFAEARKLLS